MQKVGRCKTDYRNKDVPLADQGLDLTNPPDKIVPGKWYSLTNAYPQGNNVISQRKGFSLFFDQGNSLGDIRSIFPITKSASFFSTTAFGGTIGITDPLVTNYHALSTSWGDDVTYTPSRLPSSVPFTGSIHYIPPVNAGFSTGSQTWTFVSSSNKLRKFAYPPIGISGSPGVYVSEFDWGLSNPLTAPVATIDPAAGGQDSSVAGAEPYTYVYTWYSSLTGAESIPSPESNALNSTLQAIAVTFVGANYIGSDLQYDLVRIYRKGGTQVSTFRLDNTIQMGDSAPGTGYTDTLSDDQLSTALQLNLDNYRPFVTTANDGTTLYGTPLPYIWGPFLGQYIFACGDLVQPGNLFWTNQGRPDTMDPDNNISVTNAQEPLVNGFLYASNSFVFTPSRLFAIDYGGPTAIPTFTPREIPINMGLACPFGLTVSSLGGVFFVGSDGIYMTDCQGTVESITQDSLKPIFRGERANGFYPVNLLDTFGNPSKDVKLFATGQELHFLYTTSDDPDNDNRQHLVYNILGKSWRRFQLGIAHKHIVSGVPLGGSESKFLVGTQDDGTTNTHSLILSYDNNAYMELVPGPDQSPLTDDGDPYHIDIITGASDMQLPMTFKEWGNLILDADLTSSSVTIKTIFDGQEGFLTTLVGVNEGRKKYPISLGDNYAYFLQLRFEWDSDADQLGHTKLFGTEYLFRVDQEVLNHWETPPAAFGNAGWQHIRDGYFCLRSTSDITLTITIDGTPYTYTIPSTGGQKEKVYMKFRPVKGKMFQFQLDAQGSGVFRLYGEDTQLNIKPWNTDFGYKPIFPFVAPGLAPFLRNEAGT